jgi:hypothetical protein
VQGIIPGAYMNNTCHIDRIASPDNVAFDAGTDTLLIAEVRTGRDGFGWAVTVFSVVGRVRARGGPRPCCAAAPCAHQPSTTCR